MKGFLRMGHQTGFSLRSLKSLLFIANQNQMADFFRISDRYPVEKLVSDGH